MPFLYILLSLFFSSLCSAKAPQPVRILSPEEKVEIKAAQDRADRILQILHGFDEYRRLKASWAVALGGAPVKLSETEKFLDEEMKSISSTVSLADMKFLKSYIAENLEPEIEVELQKLIIEHVRFMKDNSAEIKAKFLTGSYLSAATVLAAIGLEVWVNAKCRLWRQPRTRFAIWTDIVLIFGLTLAPTTFGAIAYREDQEHDELEKFLREKDEEVATKEEMLRVPTPI